MIRFLATGELFLYCIELDNIRLEAEDVSVVICSRFQKQGNFLHLWNLNAEITIFTLFRETRQPLQKKQFVIQTPTKEACWICMLKHLKVTLLVLRTLCLLCTFLDRVGNVLSRITSVKTIYLLALPCFCNTFPIDSQNNDYCHDSIVMGIVLRVKFWCPAAWLSILVAPFAPCMTLGKSASSSWRFSYYYSVIKPARWA